MELDWQFMLFQFFGGLGLFLFSIKYMGEGLQKAADHRLRELLSRFTTNPIMGVMVGIIVTVLIHSSTATTVLIVGLVSAGFMTLRQAIGVILGANIGTTVTAFIIGINVDIYYYPMIALGAFFIFFFKKNNIRHVGQVIFGFGSLFLALELLSSSMQPLRYLESFGDVIEQISEYPLLGVVVGTVFTLFVQSSSATVGILQGMYSEHLIPLAGALPVLFGENIGTTFTAVVASIGASVTAKRAAATHVIINVIGTIVFLIFLAPYTIFVEWLAMVLNLEPKMQIAFAHGSFNIISTIFLLPLISLLVLIVTKLIPGESQVIEYEPSHLDLSFIEASPSIALGQAKEEVLRMGKFAVQGLEETFAYLKTGDNKLTPGIRQIEETLDKLDHQITDYVVKVSVQSLTDADSVRHHMLLNNVRDIERIGDHFENILELLEYKDTQQVIFTEVAKQDLHDMFKLTIETVTLSLEALDRSSLVSAKLVGDKEMLIDEMEKRLRQKHIARMNLGECTGASGIVFTDIVSNLERIGDHAVNIADAILGIRK